MKAVIIRDLQGRPIYIAKVEELRELDFLTFQKECLGNLKADEQLALNEKKEKFKEIQDIKRQIKILKGEE